MNILTKRQDLPSRATSDGRPDIFHMLCCEENLAMCGTDVTHVALTSGDGEQQCVVCVALDDYDCPKCGQ